MAGFVASLAIRVIPYPKRLPEFISGLLGYRAFFNATVRNAIKYHDRRLEQLDHKYKLRKAEHDLVQHREIARENGIGPGSHDYPTLNIEKLLS